MSEPVFFGTFQQQAAQRQAWERTISRCTRCHKAVTGVGHHDNLVCADCYAQEQIARRTARQAPQTPNA